MALTEEQREIALRAVDLVLSNLADRSFDVHVCDEDVVEDIRQSLAIDIATIYTEAPVAPPASEQKPEAVPFGWKLVPTTVTDEMHMAARIARVEGESTWQAMLDAAPEYPDSQPDYKAQRDADRYRWLREALSDRSMRGRSHHFCSISNGHPEELDEAIDAAIASVKGGA